MPLMYHLYIAFWGVICYLPPVRGNQKQPLNQGWMCVNLVDIGSQHLRFSTPSIVPTWSVSTLRWWLHWSLEWFFHNIFPAQKFQLVVNWCLGLVNWCLGLVSSCLGLVSWCLGLVNWCLGVVNWCLGARWFGFRWDPRKWKGIATWGHPDLNPKPPIYHELKVDYFSISMWGFKGKVIK